MPAVIGYTRIAVIADEGKVKSGRMGVLEKAKIVRPRIFETEDFLRPPLSSA